MNCFSLSGGNMKIEKYKKIKDNKYKIYLSNNTTIDVYDEVIIKNNLLYKKDIDEVDLNKIENENIYQDIYNTAVKYIMVRLRSVNELRNYLLKKNYELDIVESIIIKLEKNGYLNDLIFTKAFINDKLNFTTMGKYKIKNELIKLKISPEIIENSLEEISEDKWIEKIDKLVSKYLKSNKKYSGNILRNKLYTYLVNLGHDTNLVIKSLNNYDF